MEPEQTWRGGAWHEENANGEGKGRTCWAYCRRGQGRGRGTWREAVGGAERKQAWGRVRVQGPRLSPETYPFLSTNRGVCPVERP